MKKEGVGIEVIRKGKKIQLTPDSYQIDYSKGRFRYLIAQFDGCFNNTRVRDSQIDWCSTVRANKHPDMHHA